MTWPEPPAAGPLGDGRFAHAVDRPATIDDLRESVKSRTAEGHAIYPQGGGTSLDHGNPPRTPGVAIDTRGLNRVIDYPAADMTITVEAGITLGALRNVLSEQNQRLLIDAPDPALATLGAIFATNTCGSRRYGLGRPRDQILGVSFVTSEGALVKGGGRVVKNVAGYDFPRLITGSMGTLGVIAQMTLKVRPKPEASCLVWAVFERPDDLPALLDRLNLSATRPVALDLLNPSAAQFIGRPLGLPEHGWVLAIGFEDNTASVAWQVEQIRAELGTSTIETREGDPSAPLWDALNGFQAADHGPLTIHVNLRPSATAVFARELAPDRWAVQAHAGNGILRAHAIGEPRLDALAVEIDRLRALAVGGGGNLTLLRCPTDWKVRLRVWGEPRADWAICESIKRAFDPKGLMNPGRFVGTI